MTNDRKPLPEDNFVGNSAPFVLKITLEYPPRETESLLGFMPKEGKNFYDFEKFPDKRFYGNIEREERLMTMQTALRCIDQTSCQSIHMEIAKLDSRLNLNSS